MRILILKSYVAHLKFYLRIKKGIRHLLHSLQLQFHYVLNSHDILFFQLSQLVNFNNVRVG